MAWEDILKNDMQRDLDLVAQWLDETKREYAGTQYNVAELPRGEPVYDAFKRVYQKDKQALYNLTKETFGDAGVMVGDNLRGQQGAYYIGL